MIDHLVIAARNLPEGVTWLEDRLGVSLSPGGEHPTFGTHNRLLSLGAAYLEVIAVNPDAPAPTRPRWFGLDTPAMRKRLEAGPALVHWVASTVAAPLPAQGQTLALERGRFVWTLTVPADGSLPLGGVLPSLINWQTDTPAKTLPDVGVRLQSLTLLMPQPEELRSALTRLELLELVEIETAPAVTLRAVLDTTRGEVILD
ncbi:VOC family protein [Deinococcus psychrotolerans]|uniref:VOC family protein n=1 Tax=Deinococcus psychrotolerans TaxID=2489213 RepID=A0A3G8YJU4_9DEIO|nr:VOC family protein [Deinococcus psychrotolerans]AZI41731.1 VOC family protein [Deinococcus psychrotolerans]